MNSTLSQKVGYKCLLEVLWWKFLLSIHSEVENFGDEDETNYETDEINKENMNEFWIFIADQISEKFITYNKIPQENLVQVLIKRRTSREE